MIKVTAADIDRFLAEDDEQPVVMLNLLRFKPDGGRQRYLDYLAMAGPIVARYGAEIVFAGDGATALCAEPGQSWDRWRWYATQTDSFRQDDRRPCLRRCRPDPDVSPRRGGIAANPHNDSMKS